MQSNVRTGKSMYTKISQNLMLQSFNLVQPDFFILTIT